MSDFGGEAEARRLHRIGYDEGDADTVAETSAGWTFSAIIEEHEEPAEDDDDQ